MQKSRDIVLYNTLGRQLERFRSEGTVKMYVCGVTPYDYAHLGHGRCYVTFDMLYRLLMFLGYSVTYVRNFTDVDDKLINRADKELADPTQYMLLANKYIESFHQDMQQLNCLPPSYEPRVTTHIAPIIEFITELIDCDKAYATILGDVYYRISSFKDYGKLSQRSLSDLKAGARVAVREDKEDPLDFALWKSSDEPCWESPWGLGRPGWHIECSAMSKQYLGTTIDIHGGGMDLIFPHHENEIAQSEGLSGELFSRFWIHNAFVRINQEKMSKSLGNFLTLKDASKTFHPMVLRYYYLIHHYRSPLDFSPEDIESTAVTYRRLCSHLASVEPADREELDNADGIIDQIINALCDDLNVAKCMGLIFEGFKKTDQKDLSLIKGFLVHILGLDMIPEALAQIIITPEIQDLLNQREQARQSKDWDQADKLRDKLNELGIDIQDKKA